MSRRGLAALLVMAVVLGATPPASAQGIVDVLDVDTYVRRIPPGETATFNWTVRNTDATPYNVTIRANNPPTDWQVTLAPQTITALANRAQTVTLTVMAPQRVFQRTELNLTVTFNVYQDGALVDIATRQASVVIPLQYAEKRVFGLIDNPLGPPLDNEWGVFLLDSLLWLLVAGAILLIVIPTVKFATRRTKSELDDIILRIIRTPLVVLIFVFGIVESLTSIDRHLPEGLSDFLLRVYSTVLGFVLLYIGYKLFRDVTLYYARRVAKKTVSRLDDILIPLIEKIGIVALLLVGIGYAVGFLDVDLTLFVAGGVVVSMAIAFAAQDTLSNFFSGIFLLTDRPFQEGDTIILADGDWCEVRKIGLRTTKLFRFKDATMLSVPNTRMVNDKIANFSISDEPGRVSLTFGVAYGSDPVKVKEILLDVLSRNPHIRREEPHKPVVRFDALADSSLNFFVLVWIDDRANRFAVLDYLNTEVYRRFTEAGIEIPFPQRTVHVVMEGAHRSTLRPDVPVEAETAADGPRRDARSGDRKPVANVGGDD